MLLFRMFHGILMGQRGASAPQKFERVFQGVRSSKKLWSHPEVSKLLLAYGVLSGCGSFLLLMLNATGILFERTLTPYLVAVLLILGASLMSFIRTLHIYIGRAA